MQGKSLNCCTISLPRLPYFELWEPHLGWRHLEIHGQTLEPMAIHSLLWLTLAAPLTGSLLVQLRELWPRTQFNMKVSGPIRAGSLVEGKVHRENQRPS